ncbi:MAG: HAD family hydrolase [Dyadobacter sp.]|uniref:HAD family hydrolase n=1 Tax=Dyadobacter sp. TaxID=1914288 RepID=UPI00326353FB
MDKDLAIFDFDGTITSKDTFLYFLKYTHPGLQGVVNILRVTPHLVAYGLGLISNETAKRHLFSSFYKGMAADHFNAQAGSFVNQIESFVKSKALEKINWHRQQGHRVLVVSAGFDNILIHWCKKENIELIATGVEVESGLLTGNFGSKNCYGIEKLNRIKAYLDPSEYRNIYVYGDSRGDLEMMQIATHPNHDKRIFT